MNEFDELYAGFVKKAAERRSGKDRRRREGVGDGELQAVVGQLARRVLAIPGIEAGDRVKGPSRAVYTVRSTINMFKGSNYQAFAEQPMTLRRGVRDLLSLPRDDFARAYRWLTPPTRPKDLISFVHDFDALQEGFERLARERRDARRVISRDATPPSR